MIFTWGNVSARESDYIIIKPSGINYDTMKADDMVVLDLDGNKIEGKYNPSSDTPTHLELYKVFPNMKGITHTHSSYATSFAQAGCEITALGTTHADYFYGNIPVTRNLDECEVVENYEKKYWKSDNRNLYQYRLYGNSRCFSKKSWGIAWGKSASDSVHNAVVIEELAKMNYQSMQLNSNIQDFPKYILDKHYNRKHGKNAYYGQKHV